MSPAQVKPAVLMGGEPFVLQAAMKAASPEERVALMDMNAYRRTIYPNSQMLGIAGGRKERVFANVYDALFAHLSINGEFEGSQFFRGNTMLTGNLRRVSTERSPVLSNTKRAERTYL